MRILDRTEYFEIISLTGTFSYNEFTQESSSHFHIALSDEYGNCIGGHLLPGSIIFTTAEITFIEAGQLQFRRVLDNQTGFNELIVIPDMS
jgi:uncharacterized protein